MYNVSFRYLFLYSDRRLLHRPHLRQPKGGHDYAVFRGENRRFFFAVGDSQKQEGLCLLVRFLKMPPFGKQKAPAFSHENRCLERGSALEAGSYQFPFLILPPIRITENTATTITAEIHMGESTHIQLHWITPNSFSTIKTIVRTETMPSPPCFALLSILFLKNLLHNFCKLRWCAVKKHAYTVNFSRQNADTDCRAD